MWRGDEKWIMASYFPAEQRSFSEIRRKFVQDLHGVAANQAQGIAFVTNQALSLSERNSLTDTVPCGSEIYHLERICVILDAPQMAELRERFLNISASSEAKAYADFVRDLREATAGDHGLPIVTPLYAATRLTDPLVGRTAELALLKSFLADDSSAGVLAVTGLPGVGKTALASAAAAIAVKHFTGGAVRVDFRAHESHLTDSVGPHRVFGVLLQALGHAEIADDSSVHSAQYHALLHERELARRPVLLLFDDVLDARQVLPLLPNQSMHRVIVTSRHEIGPRLSAETLNLSPLPGDTAVQLLANSRNGMGHAEHHAKEDLIHLAHLCAGLPLALNVVKATLVAFPNLSPGELADELQAEATRLEGLQYEDAAVRGVFRSSYVRLTSEVSRAFRFLSLHPGGHISSNALEHLADIGSTDAKRLLRQLRVANLLESVDGNLWRMHDLLRLFAREELALAESEHDRRDAFNRLLMQYQRRVDQFNAWINGMGEPEPGDLLDSRTSALVWMDGERVALVGAVAAALELELFDGAWHLGNSLVPYLSLRREYETTLGLLGLAQKAAERLADNLKIAVTLNNSALTLSSLRRFDEAVRTHQRALKALRELPLGDRWEEESTVLVGLAEALRRRGDVAASIGPLRRAIRYHQEQGRPFASGFALTNLGIAYRESGQYRNAVHALSMALPIHRANGARWAEASTTAQLATAISQSGDPKTSLAIFDDAMSAYKDVRDERGEASVYMNKGLALMFMSAYPAAQEALESARQGFVSIRDKDGELMAVHNLAQLMRRLDDSPSG
ncbi:tetratricopeptide repeat protein [Motilibacter deserti]|uniref:Tetratricopeptide repeat protein n=1 Tax=Motilibacter deserti TaxID=2714956 RepID=A0ABX0GQY0_9ACTN|nr:tetratricopeptide repeat protein [Motilibacter deserti]NHC13132.1 tetratricopeptide repeat protein [Motilibacter deserti]